MTSIQEWWVLKQKELEKGLGISIGCFWIQTELSNTAMKCNYILHEKITRAWKPFVGSRLRKECWVQQNLHYKQAFAKVVDTVAQDVKNWWLNIFVTLCQEVKL